MTLLGMLLGQSFIIFVLYAICNFISLFTYFFAGDAIGGLITFSVYALIWFVIWRVLHGENGTSHFSLKVAFATIPLIVFTAWYILSHPAPNYSMMIPLLPAEIHFYFATAVTGTLLFPLYSIFLNKYFFSRGCTWQRFLRGVSPIAAVGTISFVLCYILLPTQW